MWPKSGIFQKNLKPSHLKEMTRSLEASAWVMP
jgi:hypothetical protein